MLRHIIIACMALIASQNVHAAALSGSIVDMLGKLDMEISNKSKYEMDKQKNITALRRTLHSVSKTDERYWVNMQLYDEYKVYNSDSAVYFANANLAISEARNDANMIGKWKARKAFVLISNGKMADAKVLLGTVSSAALDNETRIEYYEEMLHLHSHIIFYEAELDRETSKELVPVYKDSIRQICPPSHPLYSWYKANRLAPDESDPQVKQELISVMTNIPNSTRNYAMNAYILSQLYKREGNIDEEIRWLVESSMADVRSVNREIASLEVLAKELYSLGYVDHAYRYISYCHQQAIAYNNRVRLFSIVKVQQFIFDGVLADRNKQQSTQRIYFLVLVVLTVLLLGLVFFIVRINRRLSRSRHKLRQANQQLVEQKEELSEQNVHISESNTQLEALNTQLSNLNAQLSSSMLQLHEANYVKEEYIGAMFHLCSTYIDKMDEFRKVLNRKLKVKMYDDARAMTENTTEVQNVIKEFYANFDAIFLNIYPTFIDDFNALLKPEERITLKEGQLLNTELRIHALVCMGITDSLRISHVLHCSPQTVYNNRNRTRNKALVANKDFDEAVRRLGKIS